MSAKPFHMYSKLVLMVTCPFLNFYTQKWLLKWVGSGNYYGPHINIKALHFQLGIPHSVGHILGPNLHRGLLGSHLCQNLTLGVRFGQYVAYRTRYAKLKLQNLDIYVVPIKITWPNSLQEPFLGIEIEKWAYDHENQLGVYMKRLSWHKNLHPYVNFRGL